jgi:hypothetical protein
MPNKAIIVGIQAYAELPPALQGPKHDAERFFDWVTSKGSVARGDAKLILGDEPPPAAALNARPTAEAIKYEFDNLEEEAKNSATGQAGDRLYLYMSGHGFGQGLNDASLLMANATQNRTRHHIPGRPWADHFFANGIFKEVLLFLDCCRERYLTSQLNGPGTNMSTVPPPGARRFYGFAAKYGRLAVERMIDGEVRGVFTATLLDALNGGAAEEDGRITGETLKSYLYENMKTFLSSEDLDDKDVAKEPDLYCDMPEKDFVIANVSPQKFRIEIPLPTGSETKPRQLFGEKEGRMYTQIAAAASDGTLLWDLNVPLMRGTYQLLINGTSSVVTVKGRGIVDVVTS